MTEAPPRLYLLDVEGTIAPISLVTEQLFPYARAHFESFLTRSAGNPEVQSDLALLTEENRAESDPSVPRISSSQPSHRLEYIRWLMDRDRKSTALKSLQGKIWKAGFESGELKGTLFPDVLPALQRWTGHGRVAIYSSGSTAAQQLLFRYSIFGDLTALIAAYFDTRIGPKTAPASYTVIAAAMQVQPHEVCFFSDVVRELDPAREAGLQTRLVLREGNAPVDDAHGHIAIGSFSSPS